MTAESHPQQGTLFGHPAGLYTLFFAEMWERFSYYGMRALLVLYMIKGFLGYNDDEAYSVYGAYTALVYMTPFFGGMLADRLLGSRRAVVLGGLFMAAGHLLMTVENRFAFFSALALLIIGNGFFKPNISTIVGSLYPRESINRDGGFTIFYMGINLGASMSPLLCGYIGQTYGWHYGFGLATIGMLTGLAVFVVPGFVARFLILAGAAAAAVGLVLFHGENPYFTAVNIFIAASLLAGAVISWAAIGRGGLPKQAGAPPDSNHLRAPWLLGVSREWVVYLGAIVAIPLFALLVSDFAPLTTEFRPIAVVPESILQQMQDSSYPLMRVAAVILQDASMPSSLVLWLAALLALGYLGVESLRLDRIPRQRMFVVGILTFFSFLFWAFFEQAGSSVNNFTDRNVDRVWGEEEQTITQSDIGRTIRLQPTQEQLGYRNGEQMFTLRMLDQLREQHISKSAAPGSSADTQPLELQIDWTVAPDNIGMKIARQADENPASLFQAVNPFFILVFGLVFTAVWSWLGSRGWEPSTPLKFSLGLLQLGLGFGAFWLGAVNADERGMVSAMWLVLGYWLQTTGELCLSPVGLSMVTKLSPVTLVSTVMGVWFLATALSQRVAAMIAKFTSVGHTEGQAVTIPPPQETVHVYGNVFGSIALAAITSAVICLALVPLLKKWMHEGEDL